MAPRRRITCRRILPPPATPYDHRPRRIRRFLTRHVPSPVTIVNRPVPRDAMMATEGEECGEAIDERIPRNNLPKHFDSLPDCQRVPGRCLLLLRRVGSAAAPRGMVWPVASVCDAEIRSEPRWQIG